MSLQEFDALDKDKSYELWNIQWKNTNKLIGNISCRIYAKPSPNPDKCSMHDRKCGVQKKLNRQAIG